ncbi:MAG: S16 family serine protease [archaeon]|nr:S16 family serine protease [archaeon]
MSGKKREYLNLKTIAIFTAIFLVGFYSCIVIDSARAKDDIDMINHEKYAVSANLEDYYIDSPSSVRINLPAVNENNTGVTAYLEVKVMPGSGLVLMNLGNIISRFDTQESMRSAAEIASAYTNKSIDNVDIIYNLVAYASMLEGPSAGAAFAVATVLALEDEKINDKVMITGTINHDFTIGPAGRIKAKAAAAKEAGSEIFLVPAGESYEYNETEYCSDYGIFKKYCQNEYVPVKIGDVVNISVVEVYTLDDAVGYFRLGQKTV